MRKVIKNSVIFVFLLSSLHIPTKLILLESWRYHGLVGYVSWLKVSLARLHVVTLHLAHGHIWWVDHVLGLEVLMHWIVLTAEVLVDTNLVRLIVVVHAILVETCHIILEPTVLGYLVHLLVLTVEWLVTELMSLWVLVYYLIYGSLYLLVHHGMLLMVTSWLIWGIEIAHLLFFAIIVVFFAICIQLRPSDCGHFL